MRVVRALVALVLVAGIGAGCSGGSKHAAPSAFADATCADLAAWAATMQPAFADLQAIGSVDPSAAPDQLKKVSGELADAEAATTKLADGIDSRPAPDISSGDQVKKTIVDTLRRLLDVGKRTRAEIDGYDAATATPAQTQQLRSDLEGLTNQLAESLSGLAPLFSSSPELQSAFANSASCKKAASNLSS